MTKRTLKDQDGYVTLKIQETFKKIRDNPDKTVEFLDDLELILLKIEAIMSKVKSIADSNSNDSSLMYYSHDSKS